MENRIIKFRAWDKEKKTMINDIHTNAMRLGLNKWIETIQGINFDLMQFTGLKDKNGKEIYEGDIVKTGNRNYEVAWGEGDYEGYYGYTGIILKDKYESVTQQQDAVKWEVIGNIYENPELLK